MPLAPHATMVHASVEPPTMPNHGSASDSTPRGCSWSANAKWLLMVAVTGSILASMWYADNVTRLRLPTAHGAQEPIEGVAVRETGGGGIGGLPTCSAHRQEGPDHDHGSSAVARTKRINNWLAALVEARRNSVVHSGAADSDGLMCGGWSDATWKDFLQADLAFPSDHGPRIAQRLPNASVLYLEHETAGRRFPFPHLSPDERRFKDGRYRLYAYWSNGWVQQYGWNFDETQYHFPERFFVAALPNAYLFPDESMLFCGVIGIKHHLSACMRGAFFMGLAQQRNRLAQRLFPQVRRARTDNATSTTQQTPGSPHDAQRGASGSSGALVVPVGIPLCATIDCTLAGPFHIVVEQLTRLAPLVDLVNTPDSSVKVVVTMSVRTRPILAEYFDLMGISPERVIEAPQGVLLHQALYTPVLCYRPTLFGLHALRRVVMRRLGDMRSGAACPSEPSEWTALGDGASHWQASHGRTLHVVFSERIDGSRHPLNYASLKALLLDLFARTAVDPTSTPPVRFLHATVTNISDPATIRAFSQADLVVGVHGANLVPLLFAKSGSVLVEMLSKVHSACFYYLSSMLGVRYAPVFHYGNYSARRWIPTQEFVAQVGEALGYPHWTTDDATFDLVFEEVLRGRSGDGDGSGGGVGLMSMASNAFWGCGPPTSASAGRFERLPGVEQGAAAFRVAQYTTIDGVRRLLMHPRRRAVGGGGLKHRASSNESFLTDPVCLVAGSTEGGRGQVVAACGCQTLNRSNSDDRSRPTADDVLQPRGIRFQRLGIVRYSVAVFLVTDDGNGCLSGVDGKVHSSRPCAAGDAWLLTGPDLS